MREITCSSLVRCGAVSSGKKIPAFDCIYNILYKLILEYHKVNINHYLISIVKKSLHNL